MRIGIDGLLLSAPFPCGTKNYAVQLLKNLAIIDKKNEYIIFTTKNIEIPKQKNFKLYKVVSRLPILKRQLILPIIAKNLSIDIFHYFEPFGSVFNNHKRIITTVHDYDLSYTYPISVDPLRRINGEILKHLTIKKSVALITDTVSIKKELNNHGHNQKKFVVNAGIDPLFKVGGKNSFKGSFYLAMADFAPRKNIYRTLSAYSILDKAIRDKHELKIITTNLKAKKKMLDISRKLNITNRVKILNNVSQKDLLMLYRKAMCFVYPSLYEGFGLPILEAMACGCPVITSNKGAMKEVSGKFAILVDPESEDDISSAMSKVAKNSNLRKHLTVMGVLHSKKFTWQRTALQTLAIYKYVKANT